MSYFLTKFLPGLEWVRSNSRAPVIIIAGKNNLVTRTVCIAYKLNILIIFNLEEQHHSRFHNMHARQEHVHFYK